MPREWWGVGFVEVTVMISQKFKALVIAKVDMVRLVSGYIRLESRDEKPGKVCVTIDTC